MYVTCLWIYCDGINVRLTDTYAKPTIHWMGPLQNLTVASLEASISFFNTKLTRGLTCFSCLGPFTDFPLPTHVLLPRVINSNGRTLLKYLQCSVSFSFYFQFPSFRPFLSVTFHQR